MAISCMHMHMHGYGLWPPWQELDHVSPLHYRYITVTWQGLDHVPVAIVAVAMLAVLTLRYCTAPTVAPLCY